MDDELLKNILCSLSKDAFQAFVMALFRNAEPYEPFGPLPAIGDGVYRRELIDSYGGSIHAVYLLHLLPFEVFHPSRTIDISDPSIVRKLKRLSKEYKGKVGQWGMVSPFLTQDDQLNAVYFLSNLCHEREADYRRILFPKYQRLLKANRLSPSMFGLGSCDSFVQKNASGVKKALNTIFSQGQSGLRIVLNQENLLIDRFQCGKILTGGVSRQSNSPYEPAFVQIMQQKEDLLAEFQELIDNAPREIDLERFLASHYEEVFGAKYTRVETQLWLRFPELDIADKERRIDVFLRNSVTNDWDLFEIKRPIRLTCTYRDVPVLAHEVIKAIQQVKNYAKILAQDKVKRQLAKEGIEYYEPSLNLVVGREPQIPIEQWRWLLKANQGDVRIVTFGEILAEMRIRVQDLLRYLETSTRPHE
jgi:hypothetical protein